MARAISRLASCQYAPICVIQGAATDMRSKPLKSIMIKIGEFLFRWRDYLFPLTVLLLFIAVSPRKQSSVAPRWSVPLI
jgi:hypothetical protein